MTERDLTRNEALEPRIAEDLRALREASARDLPPLPSGAATSRTRPRPGRHWKELFVSTIHSPARRWLATGIAVAVLALAGLVIPISYDRVTGHDVAIEVSNLSPDQIPAIVGGLEAALGAGAVKVTAADAGEGPVVTFATSVPASRGVDAGAVASTFARELESRGFRAAATATPVRERVSSNVYAYARDVVVRVETSGKTAAQIEAEIRQRLAAEGLSGTQVSVTDEAGGMRKVRIEQHAVAGDGQAPPPPENLKLELTKDGRTVAADPNGISVEVKRLKGPTGTSLALGVTTGGRTVPVEIANVDGMSDAALGAAVRAELAKQGLDLKVTVENGSFQIERP